MTTSKCVRVRAKPIPVRNFENCWERIPEAEPVPQCSSLYVLEITNEYIVRYDQNLFHSSFVQSHEAFFFIEEVCQE
jgi:hypothetical protein